MSHEVHDALFDHPADPSGEELEEHPGNENPADEEPNEPGPGHDDLDGDEDFVEDHGGGEAPETQPGASVDEVADTPTDVSEAVDNVQVALAFEVGESRVSVGQLRTLSPGYTFELSTLVESPVEVKAFGQAIGKGQLVRIGDRIGVRMVEVACHRNH